MNMEEPATSTLVASEPVKKEKSNSAKAKLKELEVKPSELGYVTAIHEETRTFFLQLCRNSNEDLTLFNKSLNEFCEKVLKERESGNPTSCKPNKLHNGDLVCARYVEDRNWYRALVLKVNKTLQTCSILYVDYGNVEHDYQLDQLVEISPSDMPEIERPSFGFSCFVENSETFSSKKAKHLLRSVMSNYAMIKTVQRQSSLQWIVELPENGYNSGFLVLFKSAYDKDREEGDSDLKRHKSSSIRFGEPAQIKQESQEIVV